MPFFMLKTKTILLFTISFLLNGLYFTYTDETNTGKSIVVQHLTNTGNAVFSGAGYTMALPGATFTVTNPQLIADDKVKKK